jgi:serine/threonine-protein kinase
VQLTSRLTHPNTIAIYDFGRTPGGIFYYAMEYLPGMDLQSLLRQHGPQPPGRVIHILKQVCASLIEAHGAGLIHRDIKASNVILCERGGVRDVAKVVDFGLVRKVHDKGRTAASEANTITGTPAYMSPESIRTPDTVDHRSDLYSLGVLGYALLTAKVPFEGSTAIEVCSHHLQTQPVPPSLRVEFQLPQDIERLILQCLEKSPERRPRDAHALLEALQSLKDANAWTVDDMEAWWQAHAKGALSLAGAADLTARLDASKGLAIG